MPYLLSKRSIKNLEGVDEVLKLIAIRGVTESPFDFGIPGLGGRRTNAEQFVLFNKGASKCDGYKKKSYHQTGKAFDVYAFVRGKATWEQKYYEPIARHLQEFAKKEYSVRLEWGGDWRSFIDMPHFQIS
jgi:peptidoglycan L-alanyl-D-glutamate endopeptidase CwlK